MSDQEVTQELFEQLIEDASYLQDEAEALRYIIDTVPYDQAPPEGQSIVEKLLFLDHLQIQYYRPVYEQVMANRNRVKAGNYSYFKETFVAVEEKASDIQKVLKKLAKHRAAVINILNRIPLIDWERGVYKINTEITLYEFAREMIQFDRKILREIADMVMIFQHEMDNQREIRNKQKNQSD